MADCLDTPLQRGIAELHSVLGENAAALLQPAPMQADEAASFSFPLPTDYTGENRHLRIGFPLGFPQVPLRLRVEPSPWLVWPHAMKSGLCLHGFRERPVTGTPETIVRDSISRLAKIVSLSLMGSDDDERQVEFQNEITSYWSRQHGTSSQQLVLLDRPKCSSALFALSDPRHHFPSGQETVWLATDISVIKRHFTRVVGRHVTVRAPEVPGFYVKLQTYPDIRIPSPTKLLEWLTPHLMSDDAEKLTSWLNEHSSLVNRWMILELPGNNDAPVYCLNIRAGGMQSDRGPRYGLRSCRRKSTGSVTHPLIAIRSSTLNILDRTAILSRDLSSTTSNIESAHVICVGVGSLGGAVALQLARSGIGRLTLIDPDTLVSANIGRHVLGADDLGQPKALALQERIRRDLPTVEVSAYSDFVELTMYSKPDLLEKADLIIVTTADWESEVALWSAKSTGRQWRLLQAWSEPHTHVGHALIAPLGEFDARYMFNDSGDFLHKYTEWPDGGIIPLPACGESFIPGGSLGMTNIASMVSQTALRALAGQLQHPAWITSISRPKDIAALGGKYHGSALPDGVQQTVLERDWPTQQDTAE